MNEREITQVIAVLTSGWSGWSDETVALWWSELRGLHVNVEDAIGGARALLASSKFRPSWAEYRAESLRLRREREQREAEARALAAPPSDMDAYRTAGRAGLARVRAVVAALPSVGRLDDTRGHDHRRGAAGCRVCARHDHSDRRIIGFGVDVMWHDTADGRQRTDLQEPIPAWRLTCPRCGVGAADADVVADTWTPEGIRVRREHAAAAAGGATDVR